MRRVRTFTILLVLALANLLPLSSCVAIASEKVPVIVMFRGSPSVGLILAFDGDVKYEYNIIPGVACSLPLSAVEALKHNPLVESIEPDLTVHMIEDILPWGVDRIDAEIVHPGNKGAGVNIAIIDTGIDYTHPDLNDNYRGGIDFVNGDGDPMDDNGHGTHCAGIVAAEDNDLGVIGVAPDASIYAVKVLDSGGSGYYSDVIAGINWAVDNGMQVISMSLGGDSSTSSLQSACDNAYEAGVLVVAAAGNDYKLRGRTELDTVDYPARYSSVIAVGAVDRYDVKASFSSTGSALELAAPGVSVYSTYPGGSYATMSGTSMACPHVAGTAALVYASNVDSDYDLDEDNIWDASEVRAKLVATAEDLGSTGWDKWYGYGLVDAQKAVTISTPTPDVTAPTISSCIVSDETVSSATITWTTNEPSDSIVNYGKATSLGLSVSDTAMVTSHSVTLTGLEADTTYYFTVQSRDSAGNIAEDNNNGDYYTFTTLAQGTTSSMFVQSIELTLKMAGINTNAVATVKVVDVDGVGVGGATVYGHWIVATLDADAGITDASGVVSLESDKIKRADSGVIFTFVLDSVTLNGWTYVPSDINSGSVIVP